HVPSQDDDALLATQAFRYSLQEIGIQVSTGPVVDFRLRDDLRADPQVDTVPLLYPGHFKGGQLGWPKPNFKKANAIVRRPATEKWLYPNGYYTVVKRFSSKEERRRIVANVVDPTLAPGEMIGFENHLNVFHTRRHPLDQMVARGLSVYLNSTPVDDYFRRFNGHTQVNATDLRAMRYPGRTALEALGAWGLRVGKATQAAIDEQVEKLA
ncbi:MAG: SAM-dependent methyltransferase, partial [Gammaproteobacteria bacterium]